jgi:retinol dehydrogenase 12
MFNIRRKYNGNPDLNGKVVVITGANTGIGKETAREMTRFGAKVIIGCRDVDKGNEAIKEIKQQHPKSDIRIIKLDLSSLQSVRQFAKQVNEQEKQIDILINNAGVMGCPKCTTEDGFEIHFVTNYLGL